MKYLSVFEEYNDRLFYKAVSDSVKTEDIGLHGYQAMVKVIEKFLPLRSIGYSPIENGTKVVGLKFRLYGRNFNDNLENIYESIDPVKIWKLEDDYYLVRLYPDDIHRFHYSYTCDGIDGLKNLFDCFK